MSVCACVLCAFAVEKTGPRAGPTRTSLLPTIECSQLSPAGPARQRLWRNTKLACKGEGRERERERERETGDDRREPGPLVRRRQFRAVFGLSVRRCYTKIVYCVLAVSLVHRRP